MNWIFLFQTVKCKSALAGNFVKGSMEMALNCVLKVARKWHGMVLKVARKWHGICGN